MSKTPKEELEERVLEAVGGHRIGSPEEAIIIRGVLNDAYRDGLLTEPPLWRTPIGVTVTLRADARGVPVSIGMVVGEEEPEE